MSVKRDFYTLCYNFYQLGQLESGNSLKAFNIILIQKELKL